VSVATVTKVAVVEGRKLVSESTAVAVTVTAAEPGRWPAVSSVTVSTVPELVFTVTSVVDWGAISVRTKVVWRPPVLVMVVVVWSEVAAMADSLSVSVFRMLAVLQALAVVVVAAVASLGRLVVVVVVTVLVGTFRAVLIVVMVIQIIGSRVSSIFLLIVILVKIVMRTLIQFLPGIIFERFRESIFFFVVNVFVSPILVALIDVASGVHVVALVYVVPSTMAPLVGLDVVCAFPQAAALVEVV